MKGKSTASAIEARWAAVFGANDTLDAAAAKRVEAWMAEPQMSRFSCEAIEFFYEALLEGHAPDTARAMFDRFVAERI